MFFVMEKPVPDAQKMAPASEKSVLVPQTAASETSTTVSVVMVEQSFANPKMDRLLVCWFIAPAFY
jgi:hypothetical protein